MYYIRITDRTDPDKWTLIPKEELKSMEHVKEGSDYILIVNNDNIIRSSKGFRIEELTLGNIYDRKKKN